eukprot:538615-Alexandrium_andersonii.AAC.1
MSRPLLGPRGSRFERVKRFCILRIAECGLRRIAVLKCRGRIADYTLVTLRSKSKGLRGLR